MDPVEINAGIYYLRQMRADDRIDDRPTLIEAYANPEMSGYAPQHTVTTLEQAGAYVAERVDAWASGHRCTWAIAEPTTGSLLGEVAIKLSHSDSTIGEVAVWVHQDARRKGVAVTALNAALRFGAGALGLTRIHYVCDANNAASSALARTCGFTFTGPTTSPSGTPAQLWTYESAGED